MRCSSAHGNAYIKFNTTCFGHWNEFQKLAAVFLLGTGRFAGILLLLSLSHRTRLAWLILVSSSTLSGDVGIIDGRMNRNRRCRANVLIAVLVDHLLKFVDGEIILIQHHMVSNWTSSSLTRWSAFEGFESGRGIIKPYLDSAVRAEIEVILEWACTSRLYDGPGNWVTIFVTGIAITLVREESNMMALSGHNGSDLRCLAGIKRLQHSPNVVDLIIQELLILALRYTYK